MSEPFFHARRLEDSRPPGAGLPSCPDCPGSGLFEPSRKGQTHCLRHGGSGEMLSAAVALPLPQEAPAEVVQYPRRRGLGSSPLRETGR